MIPGMRVRVATIVLMSALAAGCGGPAGPRVFAAASLSGALPIEDASVSWAASSVLARQIEQGAPADLFLSASVRWVDELDRRGLVAERAPFLGNELVLVAPAGEGFPVDLRKGGDLPAAFAGRLAVAETAHVPAGVYAREALSNLGLWDDLADRLAVAGDVRGALAFVARGECAAGVVYRTDALLVPGVEVVAAFPDTSHSPIVYEAAVIRGGDEAAGRSLLRRLLSPEAQARFAESGFRPVGGER
jgi:molybdate transport system substrate-binding protein